jgi:hypothetical protein
MANLQGIEEDEYVDEDDEESSVVDDDRKRYDGLNYWERRSLRMADSDNEEQDGLDRDDEDEDDDEDDNAEGYSDRHNSITRRVSDTTTDHPHQRGRARQSRTRPPRLDSDEITDDAATTSISQGSSSSSSSNRGRTMERTLHHLKYASSSSSSSSSSQPAHSEHSRRNLSQQPPDASTTATWSSAGLVSSSYHHHHHGGNSYLHNHHLNGGRPVSMIYGASGGSSSPPPMATMGTSLLNLGRSYSSSSVTSLSLGSYSNIASSHSHTLQGSSGQNVGGNNGGSGAVVAGRGEYRVASLPRKSGNVVSYLSRSIHQGQSHSQRDECKLLLL